MKIDHAISHFGSQVALANALGIQQPAVSMWKSRGAIPHLQQIRIEHITGGKLKAKPLLQAAKKRSSARA